MPLPNPPADVKDGTTPLYAVADDGSPQHAWRECGPDNNISEPGSGKCEGGGS